MIHEGSGVQEMSGLARQESPDGDLEWTNAIDLMNLGRRSAIGYPKFIYSLRGLEWPYWHDQMPKALSVCEMSQL